LHLGAATMFIRGQTDPDVQIKRLANILAQGCA
jgi:hypothetical protein